jgi:hypothetical protein
MEPVSSRYAHSRGAVVVAVVGTRGGFDQLRRGVRFVRLGDLSITGTCMCMCMYVCVCV